MRCVDLSTVITMLALGGVAGALAGVTDVLGEAFAGTMANAVAALSCGAKARTAALSAGAETKTATGACMKAGVGLAAAMAAKAPSMAAGAFGGCSIMEEALAETAAPAAAKAIANRSITGVPSCCPTDPIGRVPLGARAVKAGRA